MKDSQDSWMDFFAMSRVLGRLGYEDLAGVACKEASRLLQVEEDAREVTWILDALREAPTPSCFLAMDLPANDE